MTIRRKRAPQVRAHPGAGHFEAQTRALLHDDTVTHVTLLCDWCGQEKIDVLRVHAIPEAQQFDQHDCTRPEAWVDPTDAPRSRAMPSQRPAKREKP